MIGHFSPTLRTEVGIVFRLPTAFGGDQQHLEHTVPS